MVPKEKLVQGLRVLYKLWNKEYDMFPSNEDVFWGHGKIYKFFQKYAKRLGFEMDVDTYFFWMNALILNEELLDSESLTIDNLIIPTYNYFRVTTQEDRTEDVRVEYEGEVQGYYNESQLDLNFHELGSGNDFDMYDFDESNRYYGDGSSDGIELESIELIDSTLSESLEKVKYTKQTDFDLFIESLTESETKFLIEKLQKKLL